MVPSGQQKQDMESEKPRKHKTRYPKILYFTAAVGFAMAAWILIYEKVIVNQGEQRPVAPSETPSTSMADPNRYNLLLGRWQRPDGGYIIEISRINPDGTMQAAYYNPQPINVSKAVMISKDSSIHLFIELNDVGYPGATYSLIYDRQKDALKGFYYQPAVQQRFDVFFMRLN
jgi:hypothetical protein